MKTTILLLATSTIFISCSTEVFEDPYVTVDKALVSRPVKSATVFNAENPDNEFDSNGAMFYDILHAFPEDYSTNDLYSSVALADSLAKMNLDFVLEADHYNQPDPAELFSLIATAQADLSLGVGQTSLSDTGIEYLSLLITTLQGHKELESPYDTVYRVICDLEQHITADATVNSFDKRILLVTTSILRYSFAHDVKRKKRKDRDWELSIGNVVATAHYADQPTTAVIAALASKFY